MPLPSWAKAPQQPPKKAETVPQPAAQEAPATVPPADDFARWFSPLYGRCLPFGISPDETIREKVPVLTADGAEIEVLQFTRLGDLSPPLTDAELWELLPFPVNRERLAKAIRKLRPA